MDVIVVANHLLWKGFDAKADDMNSLKLQKMLYFLHGWYLAITNESLIDQPFYKGKYGPVIPKLVDEFKKYGSNPIDDYASQWIEDSFEFRPLFVNLQAKPQFNSILEQVWKTYYPLTSLQLSSLASSDNSPWANTDNGEIIHNHTIKDYFVHQARNNEQSQHNKNLKKF